MKNCFKVKPLALAVIFLLIGLLGCFADEVKIEISPNSERGYINKRIFGNNSIGYDPTTYENRTHEYYGYSDYGAGIWDPRKKESVKEVIDLARVSGISVVRFPGGCGTHHYDWKKSIGKDRGHFLYGLDEFLETCEEIGAEPVITVSYFTGDEQDAADLVEYLNATAGQGHKWADMRSENGHSEPYGVKYFEIGNEDWHGDHREIKKVLPQDYAKRYLRFFKKMKAVDPSIKIGVILANVEWNGNVLGIIRKNVDFGIIHIYPHPEDSDNKIAEMDPEDIFKETLGPVLLKEETELLEVLKMMKEKSGKELPLAITEYNGGFWKDEPLAYRHCLGTALLNAELLRIFMKPEYKILMANYWNFVNEYWGMIANDFEQGPNSLYSPYYQRPNYYVYQLYHEHFGDILIDAKAEGTSYYSGSHSIPFLSVNASKSKDRKKLYFIVVNKNMEDNITTSIKLNNFKAAKADAWILNGPRIEALNEKDHREVGIKQVGIDLRNQKSSNKNSFDFIFEPHSLTAIEISRE